MMTHYLSCSVISPYKLYLYAAPPVMVSTEFSNFGLSGTSQIVLNGSGASNPWTIRLDDSELGSEAQSCLGPVVLGILGYTGGFRGHAVL